MAKKMTRLQALETIKATGQISTGVLPAIGMSFDLWLQFCQNDTAMAKLVAGYCGELAGGRRVMTETESRANQNK